MRQLRELADREGAQELCDALTASGLQVELSENQSGTFAVWVVDEAQLPRAQALIESWFEAGQSDALAEAARKGRIARELTSRIEERRQRQREAVIERMTQLVRPRATPLSWGMIALCVAVYVAIFLLDKLGQATASDMLAMLSIMDPRRPIATTTFTMFGHTLRWLELPSHEPWRLFTPILWHKHVIHIAFNLVVFRDAARVIERRHGSRYLALFILVAAACSNIAQYELAQHPSFGGMSGVVYALIGVIWVRGTLDPGVGYRMSRALLQASLIWLAFGFFSTEVANWAHLGGLALGAAWGFAAARLGSTRAKS